MGIIAVHCGAGNHKKGNHNKYNKLCKKACRQACEVLKSGGSALEAVKTAVIVLENNPLTNAGFGSNLTVDGLVEMDASIMDGSTLTYGGCGAVRQVKNPVNLAYDICIKQAEPNPYGLVPPSLLVGEGGLKHARDSSLEVVNGMELASSKAVTQWMKYKALIEADVKQNGSADGSITSQALDTVGAVCLDDRGHVAAASSSGGLLLKRTGRVGQAALYASGVWADSCDPKNDTCIAVSTTGCGEYLVRTQLAKEVATDLQDCTCPTTSLSRCMTEKFLKSRHLRNIDRKLGGALVMHFQKKTNQVSLLWGHTTKSMSIGYMNTKEDKPKAMISELADPKVAGRKVNISGAYFYIEPDEEGPVMDDQLLINDNGVQVH